LCQQNQTLLHVLNNCPVSRDLRQYNNRHDAVLRVIASAVQETISVSTSLTVDVGDQYRFPKVFHIARPYHYILFRRHTYWYALVLRQTKHCMSVMMQLRQQ